MTKVLAILTADWHLRHKPPVFRSAESNWYAAMERPIEEIKKLSNRHKCPVLHAGDIFDKWYGAPGKDCPTLINWCHKTLNFDRFGLYAIPGQHDLPEHSTKQLIRGAYVTLLNLGAVRSMNRNYSPGLCLQWFPYGFPITTNDCNCPLLHIAVAHQYKWIAGKSYEGAEQSDKIRRKKGKWAGYDVIVFGDNHKGFITKVGDTFVCNCGAITINKSDEINNKPFVGLVHKDGHIERHYLDTSKDKYLPIDEAKKKEKEGDITRRTMKEFAATLSTLGKSALDFTDAWERYARKNKIKSTINNTVLKAMENGPD
jgi:DNA repair exonuclease SbcCD nuclease subunit